MIDNKPFAMFFNASPRKGWNTHKMLEAAKAGAEEAGATTELVNLYDIHLYDRLGFTQLGTIPKGFRMKDGTFAAICPYFKEIDRCATK